MHLPKTERRRRDKQLMKLYAEGLTCSEIAARVGMAKSGVNDALRRLGVQLEWRFRKGGAAPDSDRDQQAAALYQSGLTIAQVADRIGMSPSGLSACLRRLGIQARPSGRSVDLARDQQIASLYVSGHTLQEIASDLAISPAAARDALQRTDTPMRPKGEPRRNPATARRPRGMSERVALYAAERASGKSYSAIAKAHGVSRQAVFSALQWHQQKGDT